MAKHYGQKLMEIVREPQLIYSKERKEKRVDPDPVQISSPAFDPLTISNSQSDPENLDLEKVNTVRTIRGFTLRGKNDDLPQ